MKELVVCPMQAVMENLAPTTTQEGKVKFSNLLGSALRQGSLVDVLTKQTGSQTLRHGAPPTGGVESSPPQDQKNDHITVCAEAGNGGEENSGIFGSYALPRDCACSNNQIYRPVLGPAAVKR
jgi:hypothetical protein